MEENIPMPEDFPELQTSNIEPQTTSKMHDRIIQQMKKSGGFQLTWFLCICL